MFDYSLHLQHFNNGCSRLQGVEGFKKITQKNGYVGWGPSTYDPNGSCYWISQGDMDDIWKFHDSNITDHELGWPPEWSTKDKSFNRINCDNPPNKRIATGKEPGANELFTGNSIDSNGNIYIDPDRYNGRISSGLKECVSDKTPLDNCSVSGPRNFNDPNELANNLCSEADDISKMAEGADKTNAINDWNAQATELGNRMAGEQDYLSRRSAEHQDRMNQFEPDSLEYNRAKANKDWCDNYNKQLGESREALQNKYNDLNKTNSKSADGAPSDKDDKPSKDNVKGNTDNPPSEKNPSTEYGQKPPQDAGNSQVQESTPKGRFPESDKIDVGNSAATEATKAAEEAAKKAAEQQANAVSSATGMSV